MVNLRQLGMGWKVLIAAVLDIIDFLLSVIISWFPGIHFIGIIYQGLTTFGIMIPMIGSSGILTAWEIIPDLVPGIQFGTTFIPTYTIATIASGGGYE